MINKKQNKGFVKQHIVPKTYLNHFAVPGRKKKTFLIGVRQKNLSHFIRNTDDVGYIDNYYDDDAYENIKHWEHFYNNEIEAPLSQVITNLIAGLTLSNYTEGFLKEEERRILCRFIVTQFIRVPQFIDWQITNAKNNLLPKIKEQCLIELGTEFAEIINNIEIYDKTYKHMVLSYVNNSRQLERFSQILLSKPWIVYINGCRDFMPFITSDNPIVLSNIISCSYSRSDNGLGNKETLIFCPINPFIGIGIYPNQFSSYFSDIQYTTLSNQDIPFIVNMNCCEISQCYNQAFFPIDLYNEVYKEV